MQSTPQLRCGRAAEGLCAGSQPLPLTYGARWPSSARHHALRSSHSCYICGGSSGRWSLYKPCTCSADGPASSKRPCSPRRVPLWSTGWRGAAIQQPRRRRSLLPRTATASGGVTAFRQSFPTACGWFCRLPPRLRQLLNGFRMLLPQGQRTEASDGWRTAGRSSMC